MLNFRDKSLRMGNLSLFRAIQLKMNKKYVMLCTGFLLCTALTAQDKDSIVVQELDEVVVSDSRFSLKRENSGKTVITITAKELERNQGRTVAEIINTKSGIEITGSRGRQGDLLGVSVRGGRGRQALIIIDGVRMANPSSFSAEYDLRLLNTSAIESIEIVKGAASTLYGTNAATAVINITTKKSSKKTITGNFQSSLGTNQTADDQNYNLGSIRNSVFINGSLDKFTYGIDFSNRFDNGISAANTVVDIEDQFSQFGTNVKLGYQFSKQFKLSVYGNLSRFDTDFDDSMVEADNTLRTDQQRVGIAPSFSYTKGALHLNAAYTDYETNLVSSFGESVNNGSNLTVDFFNKYVIADKFSTIVGINYINDKANLVQDVDFTIVDPYLNAVYVSGFGLNFNTGARLNTHSEYGTNFVYNLNPSYVFTTSNGYVKLLGSYATSYITPNLTQLFSPFGGNIKLEPEENTTIEGGIEYLINNKLRFSTLYFDRNEENTIGFDPNTFQSINVADEINVSGIELELDWDINEELQLNTNYTYTNREGDDAIRIPKHKVNTSLSYVLSDVMNLSLQYQFTGERIDTVFPPFPEESFNVNLDAFSTLDFYISKKVLHHKMLVFLNFTNIFNTEFTEVFGFNARGRNINVGFNLNL